MALGKWTNEKQQDLFIAAASLPRSPGHPFYQALNRLLAEAGFDAYVEELCAPLYKEGGRRVLRGHRLAARHRVALHGQS
ncbi:MAG: hypothetical protein ACK5BN_22850, partial [Planctomycetota bacterium]